MNKHLRDGRYRSIGKHDASRVTIERRARAKLVPQTPDRVIDSTDHAQSAVRKSTFICSLDLQFSAFGPNASHGGI
jgi:hypothetical protein